MNAPFKYDEKSLLGGWGIDVLLGHVPIGTIRNDPLTGGYQYFRGPENILTPSSRDKDLGNLKKKIEASGNQGP